MVNNVFSGSSNAEDVKANNIGNMIKDSIAQDKNTSCDYNTANVPRPARSDQDESGPLDLEAKVPTRERTKIISFSMYGFPSQNQ